MTLLRCFNSLSHVPMLRTNKPGPSAKGRLKRWLRFLKPQCRVTIFDSLKGRDTIEATEGKNHRRSTTSVNKIRRLTVVCRSFVLPTSKIVLLKRMFKFKYQILTIWNVWGSEAVCLIRRHWVNIGESYINWYHLVLTPLIRKSLEKCTFFKSFGHVFL